MTYKRKDTKFNTKLCAIADRQGRTSKKECALKSLWHAAIAGVGIYELRNHKTILSKVLACGLIAFHVDAAICDYKDRPTLLQRILRRLA